MSIPTNELVWAGIWNPATYYPQYQFVQSPIDNFCYVNINIKTAIGGPDPSVQPSAYWFLLNPPALFPPAYGSFSSTQIQPVPQAANYPIVHNTIDSPYTNLIVALPSTNIQVVYSGLYRVSASIQCDRTLGGNSEIDMYPSVNGTPVPNSATKLRLTQTEEMTMMVEYYISMAANDTLQMNVYSPDANNRLLAAPAAAPKPSIPSIITTILRIA